jgi:hypothetical protein
MAQVFEARVGIASAEEEEDDEGEDESLERATQLLFVPGANRWLGPLALSG